MKWVNFKKSPLLLCYLFCLIFLLGCGADEDQNIEGAIETALTCLTYGDCQCAIDVLEEVGVQSRNSLYLKTYASGYACRAGYSTTVVFADDISKLASPSMLGGFTRFTGASDMDTFDEQSFLDLQQAIDILLYAGGISTDVNPNADRRALFFTSDEAGDINAQLFFMLMTQIGKYLYFYGDADSGGNKGQDDGDTCLLNYEAAVPYAALSANNNCDGAGTGSARLGVAADHNTKRMCQGVVLFNAFYDILPSLVGSFGGDDFDGLSTISDEMDDALTDLAAASATAADIVSLISQSVCESSYGDDSDSSNDDDLEYYFFFTLENLFE